MSSCGKCEKKFKNDHGLRMHDLRAHTRKGGWSTKKEVKRPNTSKDSLVQIFTSKMKRIESLRKEADSLEGKLRKMLTVG